jgi:60 kDa SS-A/Ro ribonucleoprotein
MTDALKTVKKRVTAATATSQSEKAVKGQKRNNAGGFTFVVSDMDRAKRFLILGSESNHYVSGEELSKDNAKTIIKLASDDATATDLVDEIVAVSTGGRAAKQNPALFALAIAVSYGSVESRAYALSKLNEVARTATHLFLFATYVEQFRGWGPALRRAIANWYLGKDVDKAAYQVAKYPSRENWTHRDLFRLSHPKSSDEAFQGLGEWVLKGDKSKAPKIIKGVVKARKPDADIPKLIAKYGLSWEMLPTDSLNTVETWDALFAAKAVPLGALIRQLTRLTRIGFIKPLDARADLLVSRLTDATELEKARIHPVNILQALRTYQSGRNFRGSSSWTPDPRIVAALDQAFYLSFKAIVPSNKRTLIGLDVSGSMGGSYNGESFLTSRDVTVAMSMVTVATEPSTHIIGFTGGGRNSYTFGYNRRKAVEAAGTSKYASTVTNLSNVITKGRKLEDVIRDTSGLPFGATDCSLPMLYAMEQGLSVDTFVILTDNDTWAGDIHPFEALKQYRAKTGIDARLVVMSTIASKFSIADPSDAGMLDIAGFDSAAPGLVADFSRGDI